jgi:hypothetical protein
MRYCLIITFILLTSCNIFAQKSRLMIRISEIEMDSNYLEEYNSILKEESRESMKLELALFLFIRCTKRKIQHR